MPTSQNSKNKKLLDAVSGWFEQRAQNTLQDIADTRRDRNRIIRSIRKETIPEKIKYHLQQMANTGKLSVAEMFKYLTIMASIGLVDNAALRKLEKVYANLKRNDIKFIDWVKRHPTSLSYISYYAIIAALSLATFGTTKEKAPQEKKEEPKKEIIITPEPNIIPKDTLVVNHVSKYYDMNDSRVVTKFVKENWHL